ncbi:MAG: UPF0182 family protein [Clostridia bacterium]|nr:UPF0182 family protein [Clostridia bacterium]
MKIDINPNFKFNFKWNKFFGGKKNIYVVLGILLGLLILLFNSTHIIANLQWFDEVGYTRTYLTRALAIAGLTLPIFLLLYIISILYYKSIAKKYDLISYPRKTDEEIRKRNRYVYTISGIFFLIVAYGLASDYWYVILQYFNSVDFNQVDPIFSKDISFYVFRLPMYQFLVSMAISVVVLLVLLTVLIYLLIAAKSSFNRLNFRNARGILHVIKSGFIQFAGRALAMLISLFMVLLALKYYMDSYLVMFNESGVVYGPGYTDIRINVPFLRIIALLSAVSAVVVAYGILKKKANLIAYPVVGIFALSLIRVVAVFAVEALVVNPNQLETERPYIENNISMTRQAFGINDVEIRQFEADKDITPSEINANRDVVDSIKINSYRHTLDFIKQAQVIRGYYDFNDVDVDRYVINGEKKQVFLSAREIDRNLISPGTWQNMHLFYTHGYGVVMSDSSTATSQGQPDFLMKDIPTTNTTDIPLENPRIYFGELVSDYVIVGTEYDEFDYPRGGENETYRYSGDAGIRLSFFNRLLYAIEEKEPKILISSLIDENSSIIRKRNIRERVITIAPFLTYDSDPYLVVADSKVYWMIDAYTISDQYPNARTFNGINYVRNSVKVTVDAYTGEVDFYLADPKDPIATSYNRIFGGLFQDLEDMPEPLKEHIKYPEDLFEMQTTVLEQYHVTDAGIFYNGEDVWEKSKVTTTNDQEKMAQEPYSLFTSFGDEEGLELVFTEYYTIKGKENMVAIVNVRMEGDHYGQLVEYKFPPQKTVSSPYLFRNKLNQDPEISKELSLLDSGGSAVEFGDMVIAPIENSLLYVVPIYLVAEGENSIPEIKRYVLSNDDQIVIGDTFMSTLGQLFDFTVGEEQEGPGGVVEEGLAREANDLFDQATAAQRAGDWAEYGRLMDELKRVLESMFDQ